VEYNGEKKMNYLKFFALCLGATANIVLLGIEIMGFLFGYKDGVYHALITIGAEIYLEIPLMIIASIILLKMAYDEGC